MGSSNQHHKIRTVPLLTNAWKALINSNSSMCITVRRSAKIVICAKAQVCQFVNIVSRTNHVQTFAKKAKTNAVHYPKPQDYVKTTFQSIDKSLYTLHD